MNAADHIRIEQEKLNEIRRETERRIHDEWKEILDKVNARKDAHREGHLDEDKAAEEWRKNDEAKLGEHKDRVQRQQDQEKRERQQKADQTKTDEQRQSDQRKADQQKKDDQRQEDIRAAAREKARSETEKLVREGLDRHVQDRQHKIMAGSSHGPAMTPAVMNDPIAMAAAIDHPGLTDDQKLILSKAGYAVGEGWHNREAERKEELMQGERQKRDDTKEQFAEKEKRPEQKRDDFFADHYSRDSRSEQQQAQDRAPEQKQREQQDQQDQRPDFFADHYSEPEQQRPQAQDRATEQRQGDREQQREQQQRPDFFAEHYAKTDKTAEQRAAEAVKARDDAVSDVKDAARKEHVDQQVGETGRDVKERADLESTGKITVTQAEEMTHGRGSREAEDRRFEKWYDKHETQELDNAGVSRDPKDYEQERDR